MSLLDKATAAKNAADSAKAKIDDLKAQIVAKDAQIATLQANQADPAVEQQIADILDAVKAELVG